MHENCFRCMMFALGTALIYMSNCKFKFCQLYGKSNIVVTEFLHLAIAISLENQLKLIKEKKRQWLYIILRTIIEKKNILFFSNWWIHKSCYNHTRQITIFSLKPGNLRLWYLTRTIHWSIDHPTPILCKIWRGNHKGDEKRISFSDHASDACILAFFWMTTTSFATKSPSLSSEHSSRDDGGVEDGSFMILFKTIIFETFERS